MIMMITIIMMMTMRMIYDNAEPLKIGCVSLKSEWSMDSCPRRSMRMITMVMRMFLRMLFRRTIMMNL